LPSSAISIQGQSYFWKNVTIIGLIASKKSEIRHQLESSLNESDLMKIRKEYPRESKGWFFYRHFFNLGNDTQFPKLLLKERKAEFIKSLSSEIIELSKKIEMHLISE